MMALRKRLLTLLLLAGIAGLLLSACGRSGPSTPPPAPEAEVQTFDAELCLGFVPEGVDTQYDCIEVEATYTLPSE